MLHLIKRKQRRKQPDITETLRVLLYMTEQEITEVANDDDANAMEKTVAKAILKGLESQSLDNLEKILVRAIGKPREVMPQIGKQLVSVFPQVIDTGVKIANNESEIIP